jgi:oligoendopeptidase F
MKNAGGTSGAAESNRIPDRSEIPEAFRWNVEAMYPDQETWDRDFSRIDGLLAPLEAMRGKLGSAAAVAAFFEADTRLDRLLERLHVYAHLRADEDTADPANQNRQARMQAKLSEVAARMSWATPELLARSAEELEAWTRSAELRQNRYAMVKLCRRKPHTLATGEEYLLARASELFSAPHRTFGFLTNADMRFPEVDVPGKGRMELSQGRYLTFLQNPDRSVRADAFRKMLDTFVSFRNTLASTLSATVKRNNYFAEVRHFSGAIEAALHDDQVPLSLYDGLIDAVEEALPRFHAYTTVRKRALKLDKLDIYDLYVPFVPGVDERIPFEKARRLVTEASAPLGPEYLALLDSAFEQRWIDIYENRGKRSGAYSSGCYDSLPYVLLNYQGTLDDVFTLAHELGHSIHSRLANSSQPHRFAHYPIFIAEIASTLNEALLLDHLLRGAADDRFKAYLLNHMCDGFRGTVYRQTMFSLFEKTIHELDARHEPLTAETLTDVYGRMNARYQGPEVDSDSRIGIEWARIPHFYYGFYVYKYATSYCAAQIFARRILADPAKAAPYLDLLRAGGSDDPMALIRGAGVDMEDPGTFGAAFQTFSDAVSELALRLD